MQKPEALRHRELSRGVSRNRRPTGRALPTANTRHTTMKIVNILESTRPIKSDIRNAYIDFSKMT
ncbi:MAG: hypothetical protein V4636_15440, partial [Pseudomonadota bacterium]